MEKVTFTDNSGERLEMYVLEKARLSGCDYLLVVDQPEGDAQALILKDVTAQVAADGKEASYQIVSDEKQLDALTPLFESLVEDISFVTED